MHELIKKYSQFSNSLNTDYETNYYANKHKRHWNSPSATVVTVTKLFHSLLNISHVTSHGLDKLKDTVKDNYLNQIHLARIHKQPEHNRKNSRLSTTTSFNHITAKVMGVLSYWVEPLWQALKQNVTNINQPASIILLTAELSIHWANPGFLCTSFSHYSTCTPQDHIF